MNRPEHNHKQRRIKRIFFFLIVFALVLALSRCTCEIGTMQAQEKRKYFLTADKETIMYSVQLMSNTLSETQELFKTLKLKDFSRLSKLKDFQDSLKLKDFSRLSLKLKNFSRLSETQ